MRHFAIQECKNANPAMIPARMATAAMILRTFPIFIQTAGQAQYRSGAFALASSFARYESVSAGGIEELGRKQSINWEGDFSFSPL
jgi:hypothetical protein